MCSPDARSLHALRDARCHGGEIHSGFEHLGAAAGGQRHQLEQVIVALASLGRSALGLVVGLVALYIGYKYYQRQRLLKELRMARITVDELHQKLETGENPIILDLRSQAALEQDPSMIRGARHITMDEVQARQHEIPRDRDIILYCS